MKLLKKLLPAAAIVVVTLVVSFFLYQQVMKYEEDQCWQELSTTATTVKKEIATKFQDEITKLHLMEEIILSHQFFSAEDIGELYLDVVQPTTIFARIDILYPNDTLVSNGEAISVEEQLDYEELARDGERMSRRQTDFITGEQYVYYILPITQEDSVPLILIAALDTNRLSEIFQPLIYNGQANICIVDAVDGSYIMDSWHKTLGNAYEDKSREMLPGYEDVDAKEALRTMQTGAAAFWSQTTGNAMYLYFTPLEQFDWQLSIFAQENVLFEKMNQLRQIFLASSITEAILIALYFWIHFRNVKKLERSYEYIQKQSEEVIRISNTDLLTSIHNRNKFNEDLSRWEMQPPEKMGVVYLDLNGLKQINDTQSHEAGDRYLQKAAQLISGTFSGSAYRVGGDEFVILASDMDSELFKEKLKELQSLMEMFSVSSSIGSWWGSNFNDLNKALKVAEKNMYEQKEAFYREKGQLR